MLLKPDIRGTRPKHSRNLTKVDSGGCSWHPDTLGTGRHSAGSGGCCVGKVVFPRFSTSDLAPRLSDASRHPCSNIFGVYYMCKLGFSYCASEASATELAQRRTTHVGRDSKARSNRRSGPEPEPRLMLMVPQSEGVHVRVVLTHVLVVLVFTRIQQLYPCFGGATALGCFFLSSSMQVTLL